MKNAGFTAFAYEVDGITPADTRTFDDADAAIDFAEKNGFDEVVDDSTEEPVWER